MGENKAINPREGPITGERLRLDLVQLGIIPGERLLVHSSLSALGYIVGGAQTVVEALMDVVTDEGLLVMPSQSPDWSDPSHWEAPPVPESWWETIRENMPVYDPSLTPVRGMGRIVEQFLRHDGVWRSSHPKLSFAAWGQGARALVEDHPLNGALSDASPLGKLYRMEARILFLGTDYATCTAFHLAEYRAGLAGMIQEGAPVLEDGVRMWKWYHDLDLNAGCFAALGEDWERIGRVKRGQVGLATARLFPMKEAVDFAETWLCEKETS